MMMMQTCQEYAQKSHHAALNEYEVQMYEALARAMTIYGKCQQVAMDITFRNLKLNAIEQKLDLKKKREELRRKLNGDTKEESTDQPT